MCITELICCTAEIGTTLQITIVQLKTRENSSSKKKRHLKVNKGHVGPLDIIC